MIFDQNIVIAHYKKLLKSQEQPDHTTVDWPSKSFQYLTYDELTKGVDLTNSRILDIGCGVGSFISYLNDNNIQGYQYTGIDVVPHMIELAKKKYPHYHFRLHNIIDDPLNELFDWVVISGTFGVKQVNHDFFVKTLIEKAFACSQCGVLFNMLSSYAMPTSYEIQLDEQRDYANPIDYYEFCRLISPKLNLFHANFINKFTIQLFRQEYDVRDFSEISTQIEHLLSLEKQENYQQVVNEVSDCTPDSREIFIKCRSILKQGEQEQACQLFIDWINKRSPKSSKVTLNSHYFNPHIKDYYPLVEWLELMLVYKLLPLHSAIYLDIASRLPAGLKWYYLGTLDMMQNDYKQAVQKFEKSLKNSPRLMAARTGLAFCLYQENQIDKSLRLFKFILKESPKDYLALTYYSSILHKKGLTQKLKEFFLAYPQSFIRKVFPSKDQAE